MFLHVMDQSRRVSHLPGDEAVWVLILGDLVLFGLFFLTYCYYRGHEPAIFSASSARLDRQLGLANTLILLASSLMVAIAVRRERDSRQGASALIGAAAACGIAFIGVKIFEYHAKLTAGVTFATNDFFMLYYAFTAIHLIHVAAGIGVLILVRRISQRPNTAERQVAIESGASFWHLVDLLWLVLFALFYLVG